MKKVIITFLLIILMTSIFTINIYATEEGLEVAEDVANEEEEVIESNRINHIIILSAIFLVSIALITEKKSIKIILGIILCMTILYIVFVKGIYYEHNILFITLLTVVAIAFCCSWLINGFNKKALSMSLSIIISTIITGILGLIFTKLSDISIINGELSKNINSSLLIFAYISIITFGIIISISNIIIQSLDEIKSKTEDFSIKELFHNGLECGKKVILPNSIIILLFFLGISLTQILEVEELKLTKILTQDIISQNIILSLVGSIGVVISVPITSILFAILNRKKSIYKTTSENKVDGNRSLKIK